MYYYFCASLPTLRFGEAPPLSKENFLEDCRRLLKPADSLQVRALLVPPDASMAAEIDFIKQWQEWESGLTELIGLWRASRLKLEFKGDPAKTDDLLAREVAEACAKPNPLERELAFDRLRWHWADTATGYTVFGLSAIFAFALKLKILWRWHRLAETQGRQTVAEFLTAADEDVEQILAQDLAQGLI